MAPEAYFSDGFFRFLRELSRNNNREWFEQNKSRYESEVLRPSVRFVQEVGPRLTAMCPMIVADPRPFGGSVSRIYRDTRFSKDKSPYKTSVGIHFAHELVRSSEDHLPGFVLHLGPGECAVTSGIWRPTPPNLKKIRDSIVANAPAWGRLLKSGLEIDGESYARVPAGYDPSHTYVADLRRKDFYSWIAFQDTDATAPSFPSTFISLCQRLSPLNQFLADAIGVPW